MKFGDVKLPKELWVCEDEQARWFEFEQPFDLPDSVTVTKMVPESEPPKFPTMLRKMWSGTEVQEWINENWSKR